MTRANSLESRWPPRRPDIESRRRCASRCGARATAGPWPPPGSSARSRCSSSAASRGGIRAEDPNGSPNQAQTESAKAYALFDQGGTGTPSEDVILVVSHPQLKATDPAFGAFVTKTIGTLKGLTVDDGGQTVPVFDKVADPAIGAAAGRARRARPQRRPDHRDHQRRRGHGRPPPGAGPGGDREHRGRRDRKGVRRPQPQLDADQRGHHEPHQQQPRHDVRDHRPDVHHPADHVRRARRVDRPARARR